jgi:fluoride ion exporter CrcB/FEX
MGSLEHELYTIPIRSSSSSFEEEEEDDMEESKPYSGSKFIVAEDVDKEAHDTFETEAYETNDPASNSGDREATVSNGPISDWVVADWPSAVAPVIDEHVLQPTARAWHNFFYTTTTDEYRNGDSSSYDPHVVREGSATEHKSSSSTREAIAEMTEEHIMLQQIVERFWKHYDQIVMISLGSILGILARVFASQFFQWTQGYTVFRPHSVLFSSLPLNCLSCFILGLLCSGEDAMNIILRTASPETHEHRQVALDAYQRRILASTSIALFPAPKHQADVLIHYQDNQNKGSDDESSGSSGLVSTRGGISQDDVEVGDSDATIRANNDSFSSSSPPLRQRRHRTTKYNTPEAKKVKQQHLQLTQEEYWDDEVQLEAKHEPIEKNGSKDQQENQNIDKNSINNSDTNDTFVDQISKNIAMLVKLKIAQGWDVGVTARAMQHDILVGLRVGLCGAISTFSSWNSTMVQFLRMGKFSEAFWGYLIGLELPIIAYRTGQYAAVYIFVAKCRRETVRETRHRQYGLRVQNEEEDEIATNDVEEPLSSSTNNGPIQNQNKSPATTRRVKDESRIVNEIATERTQPSVRAILTAVSMLALVCILTSFKVFTEPSQRQFAISLLFTPIGGLARWKISMAWNEIFPAFPLGTFCCNILGCLLSSTLFLEGDCVLGAMVDGFSGALSTLAAFIVEILQRIDPLIFRWDGITYAYVTLIWAIIVGLLTVQSNEWADTVVTTTSNNTSV